MPVSQEKPINLPDSFLVELHAPPSVDLLKKKGFVHQPDTRQWTKEPPHSKEDVEFIRTLSLQWIIAVSGGHDGA